MAYVTGTVMGHKALLAVIKNFVVQHGWTIMRDLTPADGEHELILKGVGLNGTDQIFVGMRTYSSNTYLAFNFELNGFTGYNPDLPFRSQPGAYYDNTTTNLSDQKFCVLDATDGEIVYWLSVTAKNIRICLRISGLYFLAYLGLHSPFTLPSQFPYPLFIGGSGWRLNAVPADATNHNFFKSYGTGWFFNSGTWNRMYNKISNFYYTATGSYNGSFTIYGDDKEYATPTWYHEYLVKTMQYFASSSSYQNGFGSFLVNGPNNKYVLFPLDIIGFNSKYYSENIQGTIGRLDDVYWCSGRGANPEDIIVDNGKNYLLVPDVSYKSYSDFAAFPLF